VLCSVVDACGGCPRLNEPQEHRRRELRREVQRHLDASLGDEAIRIEFRASAQSAIGYRNRIRLRIDECGVPGFFNPLKEQGCAVLRPELKEGLSALRTRLAETKPVLREFSHLELRTSDLDSRLGVYLVRPVEASRDDDALKAQESRVRAVLGAPYLVDFGRLLPGGGVSQDARSGSPYLPMQRFPITETVHQYVPLGGFMQINFEVNEQLARAVTEAALLRGARTAVDLYCGSGNFLLPLLSSGLTGWGVERNSASIAGARRAAEDQDLKGEFFSGDVTAFLRAQARENRSALDFLVLDPPRAGLRQGLDEVLALEAKTIALCSCNAKTWALDVARLCASGYRLASVELFDMFPGTAHVEILSVLERRDA